MIADQQCDDCEESFIMKDYPEHLICYTQDGQLYCPDCAYENSILTYEEKWDLR